MKLFRPFIFLGCILMFSCSQTPEKKGDFKLLPLPQQFEITGISSLDQENIISYYTEKEVDLPKVGEQLEGIQATKKQSEAQIIYSIDDSIDVPKEGYILNILKDKINIIGKDKAGLLYAFMTLEQLLEDAKEQQVFLPLCNIKDFPLLTYRAIQLDIKHHLEKTEYYYKLMDKLAKYKVNAIIVEMEDKLK